MTNEQRSSGDSAVAKKRSIANVTPLYEISLGSELHKTDLSSFLHYGEFLDGHYLDFYYVNNPKHRVYELRPSQIILCFSDGVLTKKKYTFEKDIMDELQHTFQIGETVDIPAETRRVTINLNKNTKLRYVRGSSFALYELPR